ncbi:hypothetical protein [Mucilaginibacter aquatilis]|uniref:Ppx/GppA phosphatase domain-containing protein n=1 Tax=Mucilaginibacter aquatilis TaxID=1517760 RepID=A0A6I4I5X2_9SPHI|nr:hypothetical protein [Mucilaginibacter aquatilis]MVN90520.1 hypothetical protein [Mucilaginibacter aquatilis]
MKPFNIFDATGEFASGWSPTEKLSEAAITGILDKAAKSANSLNSIPSPFSRLHIFETAFNFVCKDIVEKKDRSSHAYKELVSDCLDALELVFNWQYHESQRAALTIEQWRADDLQRLQLNSEGRKAFAKTLKLFLNQDFSPDFNGFSIIKYNGMVIGASSPMSLMFTSSNLDKIKGEFVSERYQNGFDLINPSTNIGYFKRIRPFKARNDAFKKYLLDFFSENPSLRESARYMWAYLKAEGIEDMHTHRRSQVKPVSSKGGTPFQINNKLFQANNDPGAADIFNDHIVKVNYRIDDTRFYTAKYKSDDAERDFDFLLPIAESFLNQDNFRKIADLITYELIGPDSVKVVYEGGLATPSKSKVYTASRSDKRDGKIVEIQTDYRLNFTVGIFPFVRLKDANGQIDGTVNNYHKVLFGIDGGSADIGTLRTAAFSMDFYKIANGELEKINAEADLYNAKRAERRRFESPDAIATIYYELNNTSFDIIKLNFPSGFDLGQVNGLIIPKWVEKAPGRKAFAYSVDFGTTNTFIAYTDDTQKQSTPVPFDISESDSQMVMLQKPQKQVGGQTVLSTFRNSNLFALNDSVINQEFVPPVLLKEKNSVFGMPFRTAVLQKKDINRFELFSDLNIHFAYQKAVLDTNAAMTQEIISNIKWDITNSKDKGSKARVDSFIKELCYLIRYKTILNDGELAATQLSWFIPQSMSNAARDAYKEIWNRHSKNILGSSQPTNMVFESEAPYYYLRKRAGVKDPSSVLSLDIGGGSTDAMLFINDLPRIGTSFNFAGNVLWSNGHNQLTKDAKENGIYLGILDAMQNNVAQANDKVIADNSRYFSKMSSEEILNFWIANDDKLHVVEELKNPAYKILYLIHYCALIYHTAQWLKQKNHPSPSCIIFSGNGSKFIDLIGDEELLATVAGFVINKVYQNSSKKLQVILPLENRKEATCFGGIFKDQHISFTPETYIGTELDFQGIESVKKYRDIQERLPEIKESVNRNILNLFAVIQELNTIIPFKSHLNIDVNLPALLQFVTSRSASNFDLGYGIRKEKIEYDEEVSDSLFFYPLIGLLFEISRLGKKQLDEHTPKIVKFANAAAGDNLFSVKSLTEQPSINSNFKISISTSQPDSASFEIIEDPKIHLRAYNSFDSLLKAVCFCEKFPDDPTHIQMKTVTPGQLRRDGDQWVVTERLKIAFD